MTTVAVATTVGTPCVVVVNTPVEVGAPVWVIPLLGNGNNGGATLPVAVGATVMVNLTVLVSTVTVGVTVGVAVGVMVCVGVGVYVGCMLAVGETCNVAVGVMTTSGTTISAGASSALPGVNGKVLVGCSFARGVSAEEPL
jgi:hypothetical protein